MSLSGPAAGYPGSNPLMYQNDSSQLSGAQSYGPAGRMMDQQNYGPDPTFQNNGGSVGAMGGAYPGFGLQMPGHHGMQQMRGGSAPVPHDDSGQQEGIMQYQRAPYFSNTAVDPSVLHDPGSMTQPRGMPGMPSEDPLTQMNNMANSSYFGGSGFSGVFESFDQQGEYSSGEAPPSSSGECVPSSTSSNTPAPYIPTSTTQVDPPSAPPTPSNTYTKSNNLGADTYTSVSRPNSLLTTNHPDFPNNESMSGSECSMGITSDPTSVDSGFLSSDQNEKTSDSFSAQLESSSPLASLLSNGDVPRGVEDGHSHQHRHHLHLHHHQNLHPQQQPPQFQLHMNSATTVSYGDDGAHRSSPSMHPLTSYSTSRAVMGVANTGGSVLPTAAGNISVPGSSVPMTPHNQQYPYHQGPHGQPTHMMGPEPHQAIANGAPFNNVRPPSNTGAPNQDTPPNMRGPSYHMASDMFVNQNGSTLGPVLGPGMPGHHPDMNSMGVNMQPMRQVPQQQQQQQQQISNAPTVNKRGSKGDNQTEKKPKKAKVEKPSILDLSKMFEMGPEPDRGQFLERLFAFLEEIGQPVTVLPVVSKAPLDLYRLYVAVGEKGGFQEVTRNRKWRDICGSVNIGPSASAAYTLKKNYVRHLLYYECKFDRGGISPAPILAQMEAQLAHKRELKNKRAPSPGSNSNESFRPPSVPNNNSEPTFQPTSYTEYLHSQDGCMPGGSNVMGGAAQHTGGVDHLTRGSPVTSSRASGPNTAHGQQGMMMMTGSGGMVDSHGEGPVYGNSSMQQGFSSGGPHLPMYNSGPPTQAYNSGQALPAYNNGPPPQSYSSGPPHQSYSSGLQIPAYNSGPPPPTYSGGSGSGPAGPGSAQEPFPNGPSYMPQQSGYQQQPPMQQSATSPAWSYSKMQQGSNSGGNTTSASVHPEPAADRCGVSDPQTGAATRTSDWVQDPQGAATHGGQFPSGQQMKHPDRFDKSSPGMGPPGVGPPSQPPQYLGQVGGPPAYYDSRYPGPHLAAPGAGTPQQVNSNGQYYQQGPQYPQHAQGPGGIYAPSNKQFTEYPDAGPMSQSHRAETGQGYMMPGQAGVPYSQQVASSRGADMYSRPQQQNVPPVYAGCPAATVAQTHAPAFPAGCVEATRMSAVKRKKLTSKDLVPFEPRKLMLSLKSGLLAETTWALDTLNILLYDDTTHGKLVLSKLPGLLDVLTEHFRHCLLLMFQEFRDVETAVSPGCQHQEFQDVGSVYSPGCKHRDVNDVETVPASSCQHQGLQDVDTGPPHICQHHIVRPRGTPGDEKVSVKECGQAVKESEQLVKKSVKSMKECEQPVKESVKPMKECEQPVKDSEQPVMECEQPVKECEQPGIKYEQPGIKCEQPGIKCEQPVMESEQPVMECEQPVTGQKAGQLTNQLLYSGLDFTKIARDRLPVRFDQHPPDTSILGMEWEVHCSCRRDQWSVDVADHIVTHMESERSSRFLGGHFRERRTRIGEGCCGGSLSEVKKFCCAENNCYNRLVKNSFDNRLIENSCYNRCAGLSGGENCAGNTRSTCGDGCSSSSDISTQSQEKNDRSIADTKTENCEKQMQDKLCENSISHANHSSFDINHSNLNVSHSSSDINHSNLNVSHSSSEVDHSKNAANSCKRHKEDLMESQVTVNEKEDSCAAAVAAVAAAVATTKGADAVNKKTGSKMCSEYKLEKESLSGRVKNENGAENFLTSSVKSVENVEMKMSPKERHTGCGGGGGLSDNSETRNLIEETSGNNLVTEVNSSCGDRFLLEAKCVNNCENRCIDKSCGNKCAENNCADRLAKNNCEHRSVEASNDKCMKDSCMDRLMKDNGETVSDNCPKTNLGKCIGDSSFNEKKGRKNDAEKERDNCGEILKKKTDSHRCTDMLNESYVSETEELSAHVVADLLREEDLKEEEVFRRDDLPLCVTPESKDELGRRCICVSNIIRSLSCVPGNEARICRHHDVMRVLGRLLLLCHHHPEKMSRRKLSVNCEEDEEVIEQQVRVYDDEHWWWEYLDQLRENTLVTITNICGHLKLESSPEQICFPLIEGLLHWVVCPASVARDLLPNLPPGSELCPQNLVLEALCKLCIHETNVDILIATPPVKRLLELYSALVQLLADDSQQIAREFSIVLLSLLVQSESGAARAVALQYPSVSLLIHFLETAEQNALLIASQRGVEILQRNPELMGTSLDMLRRAASILLHLARVPDNRKMIVQQQHRLLALVMSQILDQSVSRTLSEVLFECSQAS